MSDLRSPIFSVEVLETLFTLGREIQPVFPWSIHFLTAKECYQISGFVSTVAGLVHEDETDPVHKVCENIHTKKTQRDTFEG